LVRPSGSEKVVGVMAIEVSVAAVTVIAADPVWPCKVALTFVVPTTSGVTSPPTTEAIEPFELSHCTVFVTLAVLPSL
jgi:hypothetical protein